MRTFIALTLTTLAATALSGCKTHAGTDALIGGGSSEMNKTNKRAMASNSPLFSGKQP